MHPESFIHPFSLEQVPGIIAAWLAANGHGRAVQAEKSVAEDTRRANARRGLDHNPGHRASREVVGPHSGPCRSRPYRRVRCADRAALAEVMIKARDDNHELTGQRDLIHGWMSL
jgi:hypothetical protein